MTGKLKYEEEIIKYVLNSQKCYIVKKRVPLIMRFNRNATKKVLCELGIQSKV